MSIYEEQGVFIIISNLLVLNKMIWSGPYATRKIGHISIPELLIGCYASLLIEPFDS